MVCKFDLTKANFKIYTNRERKKENKKERERERL